MDIYDEIKDYTIDELELIISTQKDLYSDEEMKQIQSLLKEKQAQHDAERRAELMARLPDTILCPKCDGPNPFSNEKCCFCGQILDKSKYYTDEYYDTPIEDDDIDTSDNNGDSFTFHYIISFLIPLIGFIVGAIMLASYDIEKRSCGKACIILGIASILISSIIATLFFF